MAHGHVPTEWSAALVTPIFKCGSRQNPANYRPISVLPAIARLFASIVRAKLEDHIRQEGLLSENQIGSRKGYRTSDHIATLLTLMQKKKLQHRPFHLVFIDLKNAFDTVDHGILIHRLTDLKINPAVTRILADMYSKAMFQVKVSSTKATQTSSITNGVRQGCPLSPLLFNLYIDPLTAKLAQAFKSNTFIKDEMINCLLYCDDLVIFGESLIEVQRGLDSISEFCSENKLVINTEKTKLISMVTNANNTSQKLILQNQTVCSVDSWKYLGYFINSHGNPRTHLQEIVKRCSYPIQLLRKLAAFSEVRYSHLQNICTALVESLVLYASEAWGAFISWDFGSFDKSLIERVNFRCCKSVLQVGSVTDNNGARSEAGKLPLLYNLQKRLIKYWAGIQKRPNSIVGRLISDESYSRLGIRQKVESGLSEILTGLSSTNLNTQIAMHRTWFIEKFTAFWTVKVENSQKLKHFYFTFKHEFGAEKYLQLRMDPQLRRTLAKFRLGNHKLATETLRYIVPKIPYANRMCPLCKAEAETEAHFLLKCSADIYTVARSEFIAKVATLARNFSDLTCEDKVFYLMTQEDESMTKWLAEYILQITKIRDENLVRWGVKP